MTDSYQYAYLVGNVFFGIVWLWLYLRRPDVRRQMLTMSLLVAPFGLTQVYFAQDYWRPLYAFGTGSVGIEDILFSFFIGGIGAVVYEELVGKRHLRRHLPNHSWWMGSVAVAGLLWLVVAIRVFGVNSIYATALGLFLFGTIVLAVRHDLLDDALVSGVATGGIMFVFYMLWTALYPGVIEAWWLLDNLSGVIIAGAPLEEILFAVAWGFAAGPAYEFATGLRFARQNSVI